ncbi:MAG: alpha/beta hydrolase [Verrucomicrobiales bacterium]|nr:alpha/beta hydrolase [Verrucomicrobiales bacterium]
MNNYLSFILFITLGISGFAFGGSPPPMLTVRFSPDGWSQELEGDIYTQKRTKAGPAVVLIHGGGWAGRSRRDMAQIARRLAKEGYVVFNISYRFAPEFRYPAQVHDVQLAVRWLRHYAKRYQVDPDRIGVWGYSSGAHLAAMLGVLQKGDRIDRPYGGDDARVKLVVAGGLPCDFDEFPHSPILAEFIGGFLDEYRSVYREASPVTYIDRKTVPFHLYHAENDDLVPIEQATIFRDKLKKFSVKHEMETYRFWGHNTMFLFSNEAQKKAIKFLDANL